MDWTAYMKETESQLQVYAKALPNTMKGFTTMGSGPKTSGHLDAKTKELVALGIAISSKCEACIGFHSRTLAKIGASRDEVIETLEIAAFMGGGPGIMYGTKALKAYDTYSSD
jgi:AhpD family alkylhydroperoxidase